MYIEVYRNASQISNVIEIIGMPAVGKSTFCRKIVASNPTYIDANALLPENHFLRQIYKIGALCCCLFQNPSFFKKSLTVMIHSKQRSLIDLLKVCNNWYLMCYLMNAAAREPNKTYVFDQGVFQGIWSILFSSGDSSQVLKILQNAKCPSVVVFLDDPDVLLKERELKRDKRIRLDYNDPTYVREAREAIVKIVSYLNESYEKMETGAL